MFGAGTWVTLRVAAARRTCRIRLPHGVTVHRPLSRPASASGLVLPTMWSSKASCSPFPRSGSARSCVSSASHSSSRCGRSIRLNCLPCRAAGQEPPPRTRRSRAPRLMSSSHGCETEPPTAVLADQARCTDRTLTCNPFAITKLGSLSANASVAISWMPSRNGSSPVGSCDNLSSSSVVAGGSFGRHGEALSRARVLKPSACRTVTCSLSGSPPSTAGSGLWCVEHSVLIAAWHLPTHDVEHAELGGQCFHERIGRARQT